MHMRIQKNTFKCESSGTLARTYMTCIVEAHRATSLDNTQLLLP